VEIVQQEYNVIMANVLFLDAHQQQHALVQEDNVVKNKHK